MFVISDAAAAHLARMRSEANLEGIGAMRIVVENDELALRPDTLRSDDTVFKYGDEAILLVDRRIARALGDRRLELERRAEGETLTLVG